MKDYGYSPDGSSCFVDENPITMYPNYGEAGAILWPNGTFYHLMSDDKDMSPEDIIYDIMGLSRKQIKFCEDEPIEGGGPKPAPSPPNPSPSFPSARLVDPNNENGRHYFTHLRTILGTTEHAAKCMGYIAGPPGDELRGAFSTLSKILRRMDITPIDPLTTADPCLIQVVKTFLSWPPEPGAVPSDADLDIPPAEPTPAEELTSPAASRSRVLAALDAPLGVSNTAGHAGKSKGKGKAPSAPPPKPSSPTLIPMQVTTLKEAVLSYATATVKPGKAKQAPAATPTPVCPMRDNPVPRANLPPPCPSLVLSISNHSADRTLRSTAGISAPAMVPVCNSALASAPTFASVWVSAARWTPKGNLVVFAGPETMRAHLFAASHLLTSAVSASLPDTSSVTSRLNVHWGKVLINGVPTGISKENPTAHSPASCLQEIIANNPSFRKLKVTQLPSWVRPPCLFQPHSMSSLVMAFEDPDGTLTPSLIRERQAFAFGAHTLLKKWKQRNPPSPINRHHSDSAKGASAPARAHISPPTISKEAEAAADAVL